MRYPAVSGKFYPAEKKDLIASIEEKFTNSKLGPGELPVYKDSETTLFAGIVPHAGYMFSGYQAAYFYKKLAIEKLPETIIILGPNHYGFGKECAICSEKFWNTPLGNVPLNFEMREFLFKKRLFEIDSNAHVQEHSIEVQLPFLQYLYKEKPFNILPISISCTSFENYKEIADILKELLKKFISKKILFLISSDFTHFETAASAKKKDMAAIEYINNIKALEFYNYVVENNISICGLSPITVLLLLCEILNIKEAELLKYGNSGDVQPSNSIVAYASFLIRK